MTLITNIANSGHWLRLQAKCLALASVLAILGAVPGHGAEASRPGIADRCSGADCAEPPARGVTVYRGLVLDYEVIDGMAVHGGDIVLGTAAEAAAAAPSREPAKPEGSAGPPRRDISGTSSSALWPGGRVPYEIDERIAGEDLEVIHAALEEWNSKTVIEFFPRTDEQQYALLVPRPEGRTCSSVVGRGSPTTVWTGGCDLLATIHELGHAVGLWHEHQRADRDRFLVVHPERARRKEQIRASWGSDSPTFTGPCDYRSVMHYGPFDGVFSIPRGIPIARSGRLSEGDIDGVARLYGEPPGAVTVATNPPGLQLIVDGDSVTAPATFDWPPGSVHTLEAPLVSDRDSRPYVFGRWSDGGDRGRTVTVDVADSTWFEANYIQLVRIRAAVSPADAGTVALAPESPDGWYPRDSPVDATPIPAGGRREFARYRLVNSASDVRLVGEQQARITPGRDVTIEALFRTPPLYRINSNPEGLAFHLNTQRGSSQWRTPSAFQRSESLGATVSAAEFPPYPDAREETGASSGRYRFHGWSDGGERERNELEVPAAGGSLTMQVQREFQLSVPPEHSGAEIVVSPASEDGYHPSGSQVQLTAIPDAGRYFLGWEDGGTKTTRSVIMDRDRTVGANSLAFEPVLVRSGEPVQAAPLGGRHYFRVPEGTSEAAIRFESALRDAAFQVSGTHGSPRLGSTDPSGSDTITLTREGLTRWLDLVRYAPWRGGPYLKVWAGRGSARWSGTLHVTIQRDWIGGVWPPAFTFVSAAGWSRPLRQTLRVTPVAGEIPPVRYRIVSDSHWLEAFPPEWTGAQGEAEIAVTANGAALGPEAYGGKLKILILRDGDAAEGWTPTGIEIPVHFVVKPPTGAGVPPGDGSSGLAIQRGYIGWVWPPAFTFVSAAGSSRPLRQTLRVTPVAGEIPPVRYRIVSDSHWLEAFPPEWTGAQGEAEIAVTANGAALGPEAYGGKLKILILRDGDAAEGWTPTGIEIPVHFVVKPADGAKEPTGDGSSGLAGGDDHGDTREAATELAAGAAARGRLERVGDEDWFRFRTTAAQTWITAYTVSEGDTTGELHVAGSGSPLADDDAGSGGNFRIVTSVPAGTHYLRVRGFGTADYALTLEAVPDDHGDTRELSTEIAVGGSARGRIDGVGDEDWFRFRTTAARTWITAYTVSEGDTTGELHVAGGATVADVDAESGANLRITAGVPAGTHYLRVSGFANADYTLTLKDTLDAMEFARIPAGIFVMGSPEDEEGHSGSEGPQREVQISQGFGMGKYEVTQGEWEALMGSNPSQIKRCGPTCPVESVSWEDVQEFIRKLNERESGSGYVYRLPTEAEWEYAARAGTTGARHGELDDVAWWAGNSGYQTHPVGQKRANAWGLHDMLGNVFEWTADWYGAYASGAAIDPTGPSTGQVRVARGGGWGEKWTTDRRWSRSAARYFRAPGERHISIGFRLVRTQAGGSSIPAAEDDHGDRREAATEVALGDSVRGRIGRIGDEDWFRFRTTAARTSVTMRTVSEGVTAVEVHAAGASLADGDAGSGANFQIVTSVPAGTHYLRVRGLGTVDYTLTLQDTLAAMEFVRIPAGTFVMGSPEDEEDRGYDEGPQREVTLSQAFWIGKYEVTQREWEALMGTNPSLRKNCGPTCPVEYVSWEDVQEFIRTLNERYAGKGYRYRLPTEAEWEYAARAGTTGARHGELDDVAWWVGNSGYETHPVGQKRPNAWGLHDMLGNVQEWTADWYGNYASGAVTDPTGPSTGSYRVLRGGGERNGARLVRSAGRNYYPPGDRGHVIGFRLVRTD